jgi:hypothetical protein
MAGVGEARGDAVTLGDTKRWESVRYWCSNPLWCLAPLRRGFSLADDAPLAWSPFFSALDQPKLFFAFWRTSSSSLQSILAASAYVFPKSREALRS